jgi:hypothetical protein
LGDQQLQTRFLNVCQANSFTVQLEAGGKVSVIGPRASAVVIQHNPGLLLAFPLDIIPLRRHLHLIGLSDSPLCRRCGAEDVNSVHILFECEALASLRHTDLDSFVFEPEDTKTISLGAIWNFSKVTGLP